MLRVNHYKLTFNWLPELLRLYKHSRPAKQNKIHQEILKMYNFYHEPSKNSEIIPESAILYP